MVYFRYRRDNVNKKALKPSSTIVYDYVYGNWYVYTNPDNGMESNDFGEDAKINQG